MSKPKKLYRSESDKMVAGVAGGIAEYLNIDSSIVRIVFVLTSLWFIGFVIYAVMWMIVPTQSNINLSSQEAMSKNVEEMKDSAKHAGEKVKEKVAEMKENKDEE